MSKLEAMPPFAQALVIVFGIVLILYFVFLLFNLLVRPFLKTIFRARRRAREVFYEEGILWGKTALTLQFDWVNTRGKRAALKLLYWIYSSWLYTAFRGIEKILVDNLCDIIDKGTDIIIESKVEKVLKDKADIKNSKKGKKIVCEHAKACTKRFECKRATPTLYAGENSSKPCTVISEMVEMVEYEPTATCPHVRCAAACKGKCRQTTCQHHSGHEITENCLDPYQEDECLLRAKDRGGDVHDCRYQGLIHCIVADSTIDINLSFKAKKENTE